MNITKSIRRYHKKIASGLMLLMVVQIAGTTSAWALGTGPAQPEFQDFEPSSTTEMVDPFSGDFTYNIPLFELPGPNGGYPFNLSYHAGISTDQEASWVGLGWTLNPGAITRQVRGLPDEFKGDKVETLRRMRPNRTYGVGVGFGAELAGADPFLSEVGFSAMYNNYNGISYSLDGGFGFPLVTSSGITSSLGVDFGINTNEGLSLKPSFNLSNNDKLERTSLTNASLGLGYQSRYGLTDLSYGVSNQKLRDKDKGEKKFVFSPLTYSYSSSLSLASSGFTPKITAPMVNRNFAFKVSAGGSFFALYGKGYAHGFYNEQDFKDRYSVYNGYGYKYLQEAGDKDLMDYNRERDGIIQMEAPNLPIPVLTHDIYSVTGQGVGAMFKPLRNDIGRVHDNLSKSDASSVSLGFDIGPGAAHFGANFGLMIADNISGDWSMGGGTASSAQFRDFQLNSTQEPWHYKVRGEHDLLRRTEYEGLNGDRPIGLSFGNGSAQLPVVNWTSNVDDSRQSRLPRTKTIQALTNDELLNGNGPVIDLFKTGNEREIFREEGHHVGGYITTNEDGLRYVYAIPVYNHEKQEVIFGTNHNDSETNLTDGQIIYEDQSTINQEATSDQFQYYTSTKTAPYAHSYLLTAVVGPDYVDVGEDGLDQKDLGYWVKFNYEETHNEFHWKTPYEGAFFDRGFREDTEDNRGNYQFGSKEVWYLNSVETKTHIAEFELQDRLDNLEAEAPSEFDGMKEFTPLRNKRLASIKLSSKNINSPAPERLLKVVFDNEHYELCKQSDNSIAPQKGKLTLKGIHFEYGRSSKLLNEYAFQYRYNEDYDENHVDRWGFYKEESQANSNKLFPFVDQLLPKETLDRYAAMWSLTEIHLPSGSTIEIDYEMDDYAYVQHKRAMEMVPVTNESLTQSAGTGDNRDYRLDFNTGEFTAEEYFNALEGEDVYFNADIDLRDGNFEQVSGYVEPSGHHQGGLLFTGRHHPISERSWQHMRVNQPRLTYNISSEPSLDDFFPFVKILATLSTEIQTIFRGFNSYANGKGWAHTMNKNRSWVRLPVLDGIKYGGGHRVKRVLIREDKNDLNTDVYGQVYLYRTAENGMEISSGVAQNEPVVGGEESPLRKAKKYTKSFPLRSNNNLFFEYPVNEGSFPGPGIGYSKVTVMSLASAERSGTQPYVEDFFPAVNIGTTGKMVYDFFTAREFPTRTYETKKEQLNNKSFSPLLFLGLQTAHHYSAAQGYSIVNNDMHGKLKRTSQFRLSDNGVFEAEPFSYTQYSYLIEESVYETERVFDLKNDFEAHDSNENLLELPANGIKGEYLMGVEQEAVIDGRRYLDQSFSGGGDVNLDLIPPFFTVPSGWPNVSENTKQLTTAVSNKVIHKSGIMNGVETFQDGARVNTEYIVWDALTGRPLLSKITDQFENEPTYNYSIPAYTQYENMGPAYENLGLKYQISAVAKILGKEEFTGWVDPKLINGPHPTLVAGDEVILRKIIESADPDQPTILSTVGTAVYLGTFSGAPRFHCEGGLLQGLDEEVNYEATIFRSGKRNHLTVDAGNVTAQENPIADKVREQEIFSKTVVIPNN